MMPGKMDVTDSPAFLAALGTAPDAQIAQQFDVSPQTVHAYRKKHGIASYRQAAKGDKIEACLAQHGYLSDSEIARRVGVSVKAVRKRRHARGERSPKAEGRRFTPDDELVDGVWGNYVAAGGRVPREHWRPYLQLFYDATFAAHVAGEESRGAAWRKWTTAVKAYLTSVGIDPYRVGIKREANRVFDAVDTFSTYS